MTGKRTDKKELRRPSVFVSFKQDRLTASGKNAAKSTARKMPSCTNREKCWDSLLFFLFSRKIYRILVTATKSGKKNSTGLKKQSKRRSPFSHIKDAARVDDRTVDTFEAMNQAKREGEKTCP